MDTPKSEFRNKAVEIRQRIPDRFRMDVLVRSPEEIAYRISYNDWFLREITERGKLLHSSDIHASRKETHAKIGIKNRAQVNTVKEEKDCTNPLTLEWIEKAEADYITTQKLLPTTNPQLYDIICFHAQQCIEKYLKAWLQEADVPVPRSHNLEELLALIVPTLLVWSKWQPDFKIITEYPVESRYPGDSATTDNAEHAMYICDEVRQTVRTLLNQR